MNKLLTLLAFNRKGAIGVRKLPSWRPDLKVWHRLLAPLIGITRFSMGKVTKDLIKCLAHFCRFCHQVNRTQGVKGLCLLLKTAQVCLMQSLPGSLLKAGGREIGKVAIARASDGLPRLIPKQHRAAIRRGDRMITRLWLTLLGLYRILEFQGSPSLETITDPGKPIPRPVLSMIARFVRRRFAPMFKELTGEPLANLNPRDQKPKALPLSTSGSNTHYGISSFGYRAEAAFAWKSGLWGNTLWEFLVSIGAVNHSNAFWYFLEEHARDTFHGKAGPSGRLSFKDEPAGKVRVFAIVDYWTQCALKPLHDLIMDLLAEIPQDGTFDQAKPVKALLNSIPKGMSLWSLDLSAATDRCPLVIQKLVVGVMFGVEYATAWGRLLVDRPYRVPGQRKRVRYARGQPMGAYSSWAVFTLTHHMILQCAAWLSGHSGWYPHYALLGDDIVIGGREVADKYRSICGWLGMGIGIAKSLASSKKTCEFAKRVYLDGTDVSGFPWKLWSVSRRSLSAAVAVVQRATGIKSHKTTVSQILLAFGAGMRQVSKSGYTWESLSRRSKALLVLLSHPNVQTGLSRPTWLDWLTAKGPALPVRYGPGVLSWFSPWATGLINEYLTPLREVADRIHSKLFFEADRPVDWPRWREYLELVKAGFKEESRRPLGGEPIPEPFFPLPKGDLGPSSANPLSVPDGACRVINSDINNKLILLEDSLDKSEASLKHLQKLGIKLRADQASNVFTQVVRLLEDRVAAIPRSPEELLIARKEGAEDRQPMLSVVALWERWRALAVRSQVPESKDQAPKPSTSA
nr:MAG: putative RNA-dependent RNA polymerase [Mitoviridae sp.]